MILLDALIGAPWIAWRPDTPAVLHAVGLHQLVGLAGSWDQVDTATAACGTDGVKLAPVPWPPRKRDLPDGITRCRACHDATGRLRPRSETRP